MECKKCGSDNISWTLCNDCGHDHLPYPKLKEIETYSDYLLKNREVRKRRIRICMTGCQAFGAQEIKEK